MACIAPLLISAGVNAVTSIGGAKVSSDAAKSAASTQADAAKVAADAQLQMFNKIQQNLAPYMTAGSNALASLQGLTGTGAGVPHGFGAPSAMTGGGAPVIWANKTSGQAWVAPSGGFVPPSADWMPIDTGGTPAPQPGLNVPGLPQLPAQNVPGPQAAPASVPATPPRVLSKAEQTKLADLEKSLSQWQTKDDKYRSTKGDSKAKRVPELEREIAALKGPGTTTPAVATPPTVDRFGKATGTGNADSPTIEQARGYASGNMPGSPMGSPMQQRFAEMVKQMEAGTYQAPSGQTMARSGANAMMAGRGESATELGPRANALHPSEMPFDGSGGVDSVPGIAGEDALDPGSGGLNWNSPSAAQVGGFAGTGYNINWEQALSRVGKSLALGVPLSMVLPGIGAVAGMAGANKAGWLGPSGLTPVVYDTANGMSAPDLTQFSNASEASGQAPKISTDELNAMKFGGVPEGTRLSAGSNSSLGSNDQAGRGAEWQQLMGSMGMQGNTSMPSGGPSMGYPQGPGVAPGSGMTALGTGVVPSAGGTPMAPTSGLAPQNAMLTAPFRAMPDFNPTMEQLEGTPGYKFALQQGTRAINNAATAQGLSGNAMVDAGKYATGLASQTYQQQFENYRAQYQQQFSDYLAQNQQIYNMLAGQAQLGLQAGANQANFGIQSTSAANNLMTGGAAASAAGTVGSANAITGGLGGLGNTASNTAIMLAMARSGMFAPGSNAMTRG